MRRLIAVCCALALALGVGAAYYLQAPTDAALRDMARENPVNPRPSVALWGSPSLLGEMVQAQGRTVGFLLGSSELGQSAEDSAHPVRFFTENDLGFDLISVGAGGYQSLWGAIEVGALDECGALPEKKVAFLIGDQWFMNEAGCTPEAFMNSFSEESFRECMENPGLTAETKAQIRERVIALGVDAQTVSDLTDNSVVAWANRAVADFVSGGERRGLLAEGLAANGPLERYGDSVVEPDWDALDRQAVAEGEGACTNNDYGIYNEYFDTYVSDKPWGQYYEGDPFADWSETEFSDLRLFLAVCEELNITPLMVIEPVNGEYYDIQRYTKESRLEFYDKLRQVLDEAEVDYVDLSMHDYDKYYLRDVMHLGWKGWVQINRALCEFYGAGVSAAEPTASSGHADGAAEDNDVPGQTSAQRDADAAADEMLEVEGAGKEVMEGEGERS
ncbi:D-alanyl-lipoteichoic acid biosynthesis protein DltD [Adlercreutzia sp. R21]|uniref:D-alanyl-lipoteichoic acid biosynthesis protein DltD n=1 Tax=Adlercreutzia wanghongyangiae TaxID=3111451 RepID=A0ABU6IH02_9ACTN|nr:D-alanyl-lipoteichoic acid biosynthesis protein DltD [Adlercreutzia sp. R21]MEC4175710.1 D-alanyl-lipoteichoic acid biosynthesis protein DltD [Adlercreutzia sp. R7]MEC4185358.1 D-alanyl-lipoteichoic acid biosynthesis protein DltD [Adlercreutzia sp. R21]